MCAWYTVKNVLTILTKESLLFQNYISHHTNYSRNVRFDYIVLIKWYPVPFNWLCISRSNECEYDDKRNIRKTKLKCRTQILKIKFAFKSHISLMFSLKKNYRSDAVREISISKLQFLFIFHSHVHTGIEVFFLFENVPWGNYMQQSFKL